MAREMYLLLIACLGTAPGPAVPTAGHKVDQIGAGLAHTCVLLDDGAVRCWGENGMGQLGDGTTTDRARPVSVSGLTRAIALAVGARHTCALLVNKRVACWGANDQGQLGCDAAAPFRSTPCQLPDAAGDPPSLWAGGDKTCASSERPGKRDRNECWGRLDAPPERLHFSHPKCELSPLRASDLTSVSGFNHSAFVSVGAAHLCVLLGQIDAVRCCGMNDLGQLGDGGESAGVQIADVAGLGADVAKLVTGRNHSCAVSKRGDVRCWGANGRGELGSGRFSNREGKPVSVVGLGPAPLPPLPPPTAPFSAYSGAELDELVRRNDGERVLAIREPFLLLLANRPGPAIGEPNVKKVLLVIDHHLRVTDQLDLAFAVGDAGATAERSYEYLADSQTFVIHERGENCSMESNYRDCSKNEMTAAYALSAKGKLVRQ